MATAIAASEKGSQVGIWVTLKGRAPAGGDLRRCCSTTSPATVASWSIDSTSPNASPHTAMEDLDHDLAGLGL
jgi:hypothetical protein